MKHRTIFLTAMLLALAIGLVVSNGNATPVSATPADVFTIDWYTIDSGGAMNLTGGMFTLSGTIGQFDASTTISGRNYGLAGGFWAIVTSPTNLFNLYLPMIRKSP